VRRQSVNIETLSETLTIGLDVADGLEEDIRVNLERARKEVRTRKPVVLLYEVTGKQLHDKRNVQSTHHRIIVISKGSTGEIVEGHFSPDNNHWETVSHTFRGTYEGLACLGMEVTRRVIKFPKET
jgi:hypothetical protein